MSSATPEDLVPVADRLRRLRWLRAVIAAVLVTAALTGATPLHVAVPVLLATTAVYLVGLLALDEARRRWPGRGLAAIGVGVLADGLYLAWVGAATGGTDGIAHLLILGHVAGVTLVVSHPTGVKVALWHALLVYGALQLHDLDLLATPGLGAEPFGWVVAYIGILALVTVGTVSFSRVNEQELHRRRLDLEALAGLATKLEEALGTGDEAQDPATVAGILADRLRDDLDFSRVAVLGGEDATEVLATAGVPSAPRSVPPAGPGSLLRQSCAQRRTRRMAHLPASDDPGVAAVLPDARNLLVVPLGASDGAVEAVVAVQDGAGRRAGIEERVVTMAQRFVEHGALALRTARLLEEVGRLATIDGLTEVANRRGFDATVRDELARVDRFEQPLALLLLDIDHFKSVNDVHGHQTGDAVLKEVASTLVEGSRPFDTVARYGGEEFAVLAPRCDERNAVEIAERLRTEIEQADLTVSVTVSVGVAVAAPDGVDDPEALFKKADEALSVSKRAGRNRVTSAF